MKSILLVKKSLGIVEMTFGLVNASFSLPEWQAVKDFLCTLGITIICILIIIIIIIMQRVQCAWPRIHF